MIVKRGKAARVLGFDLSSYEKLVWEIRTGIMENSRCTKKMRA